MCVLTRNVKASFRENGLSQLAPTMWTKDEEQLQFALQVVTDHNKKFPEFSKQTLLNNFESR